MCVGCTFLCFGFWCIVEVLWCVVCVSVCVVCGVCGVCGAAEETPCVGSKRLRV